MPVPKAAIHFRDAGHCSDGWRVRGRDAAIEEACDVAARGDLGVDPWGLAITHLSARSQFLAGNRQFDSASMSVDVHRHCVRYGQTATN